MQFSRQEYWNGLPFPSSGDLPDPGITPGSPAGSCSKLNYSRVTNQTCFPAPSPLQTPFQWGWELCWLMNTSLPSSVLSGFLLTARDGPQKLANASTRACLLPPPREPRTISQLKLDSPATIPKVPDVDVSHCLKS